MPVRKTDRDAVIDAALELFRTHMDFLTEEDREWLFCKTALNVWRFAD